MKKITKTKKSGSGINFDSSVSDLMSCLVFIFIITVVGLVLKLNEVVEKKEEAIKEYSNSVKARNELMLKIKKELEKINIVVFVDDENGVLSFPESAVFASGDDKVSNIGEAVFKLVGESLSKYLNCKNENKIEYLCVKNEIGEYELRVDSIVVEGHADPLPLKGKVKLLHDTNMNLSMKRSLNAFVLIENGFNKEIPVNNKGEGVLGAAGFGEKKPPRRLASEVYREIFSENPDENSRKLVEKYNSLTKIRHDEKLKTLSQYLNSELGVSGKDSQLTKITYMNYRRIDLRFIMSVPKILEEKNGEISSEDAP